MAIDFVDLNSLNPSPTIELFTVDYTQALTYDASGPSISYVTNERQAILYDGDSYLSEAVDFSVGEFVLDSKEDVQADFTVFAHNQNFIDSFFAYESMLGAVLIRLITLAKHIDTGSDPNTTKNITEIWYFDELRERNDERIVFTMTPTRGIRKFRVAALAPITRRTFNV